MEKKTRSRVLAAALAFVLALGCVVVPTTTAEAAKKVTVKSVKAVDALTGKKKITLTVGKKATIETTVTVTPNKAANKKVTYKSSNKKVATVNSKGVITAKKAGTAKITVTSKKNTKKKATITVTVVSKKNKVTKVSLDQTALSLEIGATSTLKATVTSTGNKANTAVAWSSSKPSVATVSAKGVVTAKKAGTTTITVSSTDGTKKTAKCKVTVTEPTTATDSTASENPSSENPSSEGSTTSTSYQTTVTPNDSVSVSAMVAFKSGTTAAQIQEDANLVAKNVTSNATSMKITLDGTEYTLTVDNGTVKLNGTAISDSTKVGSATSVTISATVDASKISQVVAFTPSYVESVTVAGVKFESITSESFVIGSTTYTYTISGTSIVVDGDAKDALSALSDYATITVSTK